MAINIASNSGKWHYTLNRYICDTADDVQHLPVDDTVWFGSTAYVISTYETYMFNGNREWVKIAVGGGGGGGQGLAATIEVGEVVTGQPGSEVTIQNSGDEHNAVFDFSIPRGDPFQIKKSYDTIEDMNNDYDNPDINVGDLVCVADGTNNATVYIKGDEEFVFFLEFTNPQGIKGEPGAKGEKGDPFEYEDFTPAQLAGLKGEKGDKGDQGDPFEYEDFTPQQLAGLRGPTGPRGPAGVQGPAGTMGPQGATGENGNGISRIEFDDTDYTITLILDNGDTYVSPSLTTIVDGKADTVDLARVAFTGDYGDLINTPAQVNSDWNSNSGVSQILNKPNLATVATTGDYDDLINQPEIPTKTSDLINDDDYTTKNYVDNLFTGIPQAMIFKGSLGAGGTITALPAATTLNTGDTYKVITAGTYDGQAAQVGDMFTSDGSNWVLFTSEDVPSGTVTSITLQATSPVAIDDSTAITTSGVRTFSHETSGVTAGSYGPASAQTPSFGDSFSVPKITIDAYGHATNGSNISVTIPDATATALADGLMSSTDKAKLDGLAAVALTGDYDDLINAPTFDEYMAKDDPDGTGHFTFGRGNTSTGDDGNLAMGVDNTATGLNGAAAIGNHNTASGSSAIALGDNNTASSYASAALGYQSEASGTYSIAEGFYAAASGSIAHAEGDHTEASGDMSHAEGYYTEASGDYGAHAEGNNTVASGNNSHAEGFHTVASGGDGAHAEGYQTQAIGYRSHAEGNGTIAGSSEQHVSGKFNIADNDYTYAEIIGNGTDDNNRSNARALDWSGNEYLAGDVIINNSTTPVSVGGVISSLAPVSFTGDYNDLTNKPVNTVNDATLTIQKNGTTVQTFTANSSVNKTANISVPTKTSDLTNDSGFITGDKLDRVDGVASGSIKIAAKNTGDGALSVVGNGSNNATVSVNPSVNTRATLGLSTNGNGSDKELFTYNSNGSRLSIISVNDSNEISGPLVNRPIQLNGSQIISKTNTNAINLKAGSNVNLTHSGGTITFSATNNDTWRKVQVNGTDILGTGTNTKPLNLKAGTNVNISNNSGTVTIAATDTNTHRPVQVNGSQILGNNTTALNLKAGNNVTLSNSGGTVTVAATDTKPTDYTSTATSIVKNVAPGTTPTNIASITLAAGVWLIDAGFIFGSGPNGQNGYRACGISTKSQSLGGIRHSVRVPGITNADVSTVLHTSAILNLDDTGTTIYFTAYHTDSDSSTMEISVNYEAIKIK